MPTVSTSSSTSGSSSRRYPRYLSFSPGELETQLRELGAMTTMDTAVPPTPTVRNPAPLPVPSSRRSRLLKSHSCPVVFADGQKGCCHYTRGGPAWHIFRYEYTDKDGGSVELPVQHEIKRLENDVASIELAARELAAKAYQSAVLREQREYFQRATETGSRRKRPERFQMKALRAKELAGKYAVCQFVGPPARNRLLPLGNAHRRLEDANNEWLALHHCNTGPTGLLPLVVACCNRLDRCWEIPRFNPLNATFDSQPQGLGASSAGKRVEEDDWAFLPGPDSIEDPDEDSEDSDEADETEGEP